MELQHTLQWHRDRLGCITGSRVGEIMARGKGSEFTKTGVSYLDAIVADRLIDPSIVDDDDLFLEYLDEVDCQTKAMRIGTVREDEARELYMAITQNAVEQTGSVRHPHINGFASSPDGVIPTGGVLEIKCPKLTTYVNYLRDVRTPEQLRKFNPVYYWQCMSHMAVTGARWCDFMLYNPHCRKPYHLISILNDPDETAILESRVLKGLEYIEKSLAKILTV